MSDQLCVPHDEQLEVDVLAALAREGDCRHLFDWLTADDFYRYAWLYGQLRAAHHRHELHCETDESGTGWAWRHLPPAANGQLDRICRAARTLGSRTRGARHLREIARARAEMQASVDLFNALGRGDDQAAAQARSRLLELEAS